MKSGAILLAGLGLGALGFFAFSRAQEESEEPLPQPPSMDDDPDDIDPVLEPGPLPIPLPSEPLRYEAKSNTFRTFVAEFNPQLSLEAGIFAYDVKFDDKLVLRYRLEDGEHYWLSSPSDYGRDSNEWHDAVFTFNIIEWDK